MTTSMPTSGPLRVSLIVIGLLTAASAGVLAMFTVGEGYAAVTAATIAVTSLLIAFTSSVVLGRIVLILLMATLVGTVLTGAYGAIQVAAALAGSQSGPVDTPDAATLETAERKIDQSVEDTTFRVELTESELNAVLLDALADTETPFQRITVDIQNAVGEQPLIGFVGDFKNGRLTVEGELTAQVESGALKLELLKAEVGMFTMPGVARDAVEDMIGRVADLNRALAEEGADVQNVVIGDDAIVVTGVTTGEGNIDAAVLLAGFGDLTGLGIPDIAATPFEPGVDSDDVSGDTYYVALGDSLAAAVGVDGFADGYVSQVHRELSLRDGAVYGLRNFGRSGETSGTMLTGGQLDDAIDFAENHGVAYVTIDIGANDLLGHLASSDCSEDGEAPGCISRIEGSLDAYRGNLETILDRIENELPEATVIFLLTYNPFSLGFENEVAFESQSNDVLMRLNEIAADAAADRNFLVADGFTPMRGTATATTHMVDTPPDIHPNAIGYDILTGAILDALG
jgi:lysophospholipase L1-like esterase